MTRRRSKKISKKRGQRFMGKGDKRRHRGRGSRGGGGAAGWNDHHWIKTLKESGKHLGKYGFTNPTRVENEIVNLGRLCKQLDTLLEEGVDGVSEKSGKVEIELEKLGIDKVLGMGEVDRPLIIKGQTSKSAAKKIEEAGGKVE